jgi:hypothetical protein
MDNKIHRATVHAHNESGVDIAKLLAARVESYNRRKAANYARYVRRHKRLEGHV